MKRLKMLFVSMILVTLVLIRTSHAVEADLTVFVEAGGRECFHQYVETGSEFEFEYQVIEGGDLDINFVIQSPSGRILVTEIRKTDGIHRLESTEEGDYKFCLDNTFSRFSEKLVFFELLTDDDDPNWEQLPNILEDEDFASTYEMTLQDFKDGLDRIKVRLDKSQQNQNMLRAHEMRDRSIQESNFERVNFWSAVQLGLMITVGLIQVILIRSLFEDKSTLSKGLKMST